MKTLKEKIINEVKAIGVSFIPGAYFSNKAKKLLMNEKNKFRKIVVPYMIINGVSLAATVFALSGYLWGVIGTGTIDYRKWNEINESKNKELTIKRNNYEKTILNKAYNFFDFNLDRKISREEFKEGIEKVPENINYRRNFYDDLNFKLNLGEEYVKTPLKSRREKIK